MHVWISGHVQGVGFRAFVQQNARELALVGSVRNLPDGRVEAVAEGTPASIAQLLNQMARGPTGSRVDAIQIQDEPPRGDLQTFRIDP